MANIAFVMKRLGYMEIFSIPVLSAMLKQNGHNVRLFVWNESNCIKTIKDFSPHIIGYTVMSNEASDYLLINKWPLL